MTKIIFGIILRLAFIAACIAALAWGLQFTAHGAPDCVKFYKEASDHMVRHSTMWSVQGGEAEDAKAINALISYVACKEGIITVQGVGQ